MGTGLDLDADCPIALNIVRAAARFGRGTARAASSNLTRRPAEGVIDQLDLTAFAQPFLYIVV
jgi:hypothetical protein